jgi:predicted RNase H-like HicB family nuclease
MAKKVATSSSRAQGITFTVQVWKEGKIYVAYAPDLDVSSCGDKLGETKSRLREAVELFLEEAARMGTLQEILSEAGFEKRGTTFRPRRILAHEKIHLAVPAA